MRSGADRVEGQLEIGGRRADKWASRPGGDGGASAARGAGGRPWRLGVAHAGVAGSATRQPGGPWHCARPGQGGRPWGAPDGPRRALGCGRNAMGRGARKGWDGPGKRARGDGAGPCAQAGQGEGLGWLRKLGKQCPILFSSFYSFFLFLFIFMHKKELQIKWIHTRTMR
jgi:hypothetical protein